MRSILFAALICLLLWKQTDAAFDGDMWGKYRVALIQIIQHQFPGLAEGVGMGKSTFHVVSTPEEANWHRDRYDLNEDFAKYPLKFDSTFGYISTAPDRSIPKMYEKMILKTKNMGAFQAFKNAKTESFPAKGTPVSYPWYETKQTLASFVSANQHRAEGSVRFLVESSTGQTNTNTPWESVTGPIVHSGTFVKEYHTNQDDDDDALLEDVEMDLLFRRRRRGGYVAPPVQTIIEKTERFRVDFKARGVGGITINPGAWFDRNFIRSNAGNLQEFFGRNGQIPIIPKIVWVAQNPHVVIELSESEWHKFQYIWNNPRTIGMSIGGSFFRTSKFAQTVRDDDDAAPSEREFYNNEDNASYFTDSVQFTVAEEDAGFKIDHSHEESNEQDEWDLLAEDGIDLGENDLLFRRRRRRGPPPPPPPPIIIKEKVYRAEFKSNDPRPQIIAVSGEILP